MGDAVEAQLFKIHTGTETEGMYRIHRMAETATGFGGGLLGSERSSTDYFKERFPASAATGADRRKSFIL
jgi:hypothetical protein